MEEVSKVYFTDFRALPGTNLQKKLEKLMKKAGIENINFENKFVAIKIHFGEPGNLAYLRPNYAKTALDKFKHLIPSIIGILIVLLIYFFIISSGNPLVSFPNNKNTSSISSYLGSSYLCVPLDVIKNIFVCSGSYFLRNSEKEICLSISNLSQ